MATATTSKTTRKKTSPKPAPVPPPSDELEPLGPTFLDDDEPVEVQPAKPARGTPIAAASPFESDDEDDGADEDDEPEAAPVARNVGSLLARSGDEDVPEDRPSTPKQGAPTKGQKPHAAALYWEEAKRIGPAHAKATLLRKLADKLGLHVSETKKWGASEPAVGFAVDALNEAVNQLDRAVNQLTSLPVGWTPPARTSTGGAPKHLAEGTRVSVKESARKEYEGALEASEMDGLTVVRHDEGKTKVACKTKDGSRVVIPRAHLVVDASPASEEETAGDDDA